MRQRAFPGLPGGWPEAVSLESAPQSIAPLAGGWGGVGQVTEPRSTLISWVLSF